MGAATRMQHAEASSLSDRDREILDFEHQWWKYAGSKEQAVKDLFDLSPTRYYQILNQLIDDTHGNYRVRHGDKVGYLTISTDVFDEDTMCRPYLMIPQLPTFPEDAWTRMEITRPSADAPLQVTTSNDPLPEVETAWHHQKIDVLSLEQTRDYRSDVHEVIYNGLPAISKIAAFDWQVPSMERET